MAKFEITWLEDTSDEALLEEIRRVAALIPNRRLDIETFNSQSKISSSAVGRRFGSWSEALRKAGLPDALPEYSDTAILDDLKRVSDSFTEEPFTNKFYFTHGGRYSGSIFKRRFGGWREALHAAGIGNRYVGRPTTDRMRLQPGRAISNEDILAKIREIATQIVKPSLSGADIQAHSEINQGLLASRFGSVSKALKLAGIAQVLHGRRHTEKEVFENLLGVWTHFGRSPTHSEMDKPPSTVGSNTYIKRYGGWRNALKAFVERANSEIDGDPALGLEQDPSKVVNRADLTESPTTCNIGPSRGRAQSANQIAANPRVTIPAPTNIKPENRRDPSIGLRFKVLQRDKFRCLLCGRSPVTELGCELHVDHIVPFSKGGKTTLENLQTLCSQCNVGKSNLTCLTKNSTGPGSSPGNVDTSN
ncbi:MAG: HNH endonuclease [Deltaproteobacteria bacterium]|nr:HNH endonuclease [Deltaproteobacteria bacterium]